MNGQQALYRQFTYLPNQIAGLYGQLLKQTLPQWQNEEFDATGWGAEMGPQLYFHSDYQNSTIKVTAGQMDGNELTSYRYAYTPTGEAYGFKHRYSHEQLTRSYVTHGPNRNHVQNLYTGKYAEALTGLSHMDARWYDAQKARFIQPDQYNHANLMLPKGAQSELLQYIGRTQSDLLKDPGQQMRYGYVSGNALTWVDPLGLCETGLWGDIKELNQFDTMIELNENARDYWAHVGGNALQEGGVSGTLKHIGAGVMYTAAAFSPESAVDTALTVAGGAIGKGVSKIASQVDDIGKAGWNKIKGLFGKKDPEVTLKNRKDHHDEIVNRRANELTEEGHTVVLICTQI